MSFNLIERRCGSSIDNDVVLTITMPSLIGVVTIILQLSFNYCLRGEGNFVGQLRNFRDQGIEMKRK